MKSKALAIIVLGGVLQAIGSAALKYSTTMLKISDNRSLSIAGLAVAILLIFCGFPLYKKGLAKLKLSLAQPVYSTTLFLTSTLISIVIFHDPLHIHQIAGLVIIMLGVFVVICSSDLPIIEESGTVL